MRNQVELGDLNRKEYTLRKLVKGGGPEQQQAYARASVATPLPGR
jgi:hypothetical protein